MDVYDVVNKLIGPIAPIGETNEDERRFENLKSVIRLTDKLLFDIGAVARGNKDRDEYSMKRAGQLAANYFLDLGIEP